MPLSNEHSTRIYPAWMAVASRVISNKIVHNEFTDETSSSNRTHESNFSIINDKSSHYITLYCYRFMESHKTQFSFITFVSISVCARTTWTHSYIYGECSCFDKLKMTHSKETQVLPKKSFTRNPYNIHLTLLLAVICCSISWCTKIRHMRKVYFCLSLIRSTWFFSRIIFSHSFLENILNPNSDAEKSKNCKQKCNDEQQLNFNLASGNITSNYTILSRN